jgi:hypothetical protein
MHKKSTKTGFTLVEVFVAIVVVILLVGAVYWFANRQNGASGASTSQSAVADDVPEAPVIESVEDLTAAEQTLDNVDIESSGDSTQLDNELSAF